MTKTDKEDTSLKHEVMETLIEAACRHPVNKGALDAARQNLLDQEGEATLIETCAVLGALDMMTKVADSTGRPAMTKGFSRIMKTVVPVVRFFSGPKQ